MWYVMWFTGFLLSDVYCATAEADVFAAVIDLCAEMVELYPRADAAAMGAALTAAKLTPGALYTALLSLSARRDIGGPALSKAVAARLDQQLTTSLARVAAILGASAADLPPTSALHLHRLAIELDALGAGAAMAAAAADAKAAPAAVDTTERWTSDGLAVAILAYAQRTACGLATALASSSSSSSSAAVNGARQLLDDIVSRIAGLAVHLLRPALSASASSSSSDAIGSALHVRVITVVSALLRAEDVVVPAGVVGGSAGLSATLAAVVQRVLDSKAETAATSATGDATASSSAAAVDSLTHQTLLGKTTITQKPLATPMLAVTSSSLMADHAASEPALGSISVRLITSAAERAKHAEALRRNRIAVARGALAALKALAHKRALSGVDIDAFELALLKDSS